MKSNKAIDGKIRKKKIGLIFIILILLIAIFFVLFTKTNLFNVAKIDVEGNNIIEDNKVIMASGLTYGESIFKINLEMVESNLLAHPYIKSVKAKRRVPNKIAIKVEERTEIAIVNFIGSYIYLDEEGLILNILLEKKNQPLPEIHGLDVDNIAVGETLEIKEGMDITSILNFVDTCEEVGLKDDIKEMNLKDVTDINLILRSGTKVALGDLNNVKYKLKFTLQILERLKEEKYDEYSISHGLIDFTKGDNPIFVRDAN